MQKNLKVKDGTNLRGSFVIRTYKAGTKILLRESRVMHNIVVSASTGYGRNLILRALGGDGTYGITIDGAGIGTGSPVLADSTTALTAEVTSNFLLGNVSISNDSGIWSWFITDANLPDGTYTEFRMSIGARLLCIAAISPSHVKGTGEDTSVDYTLTLS